MTCESDSHCRNIKCSKKKLSFKPVTPEDFELSFSIKKEAIQHHIEQIWGWDEAEQKAFHQIEIPTLSQSFIYANETLIGYLQTEEDENRLFIFGLYLLNNYQSKGYGHEIIRTLAFKKKKIALEVFKINKAAIRFYERLGFQKTSETLHHYQYVAQFSKL